MLHVQELVKVYIGELPPRAPSNSGFFSNCEQSPGNSFGLLVMTGSVS